MAGIGDRRWKPSVICESTTDIVEVVYWGTSPPLSKAETEDEGTVTKRRMPIEELTSNGLKPGFCRVQMSSAAAQEHISR